MKKYEKPDFIPDEQKKYLTFLLTIFLMHAMNTLFLKLSNKFSFNVKTLNVNHFYKLYLDQHIEVRALKGN